MIVIRARRAKLGLLVALTLAFVAVSVWIAFPRGTPFVIRIIGGVGVLFFGFAGGWILSRLFSHRISLILDRDGLVDNSTAFPAGRIAWDQISRVEITSIADQRFVGIDVHDRAALVTSSSRFRRFIDEMNAGFSAFPVNIPSTTVDRSLEELRDLIIHYWQDPKARKALGVHPPEQRSAAISASQKR